MFIHLFFKNDYVDTHQLNCNSTYLIGRDDDCDFSLPYDSMISSKHLEIKTFDHSLQLRDLESKNGTYFNSERINQVTLGEGEQITLGQTRLLFTQNPFKQIKQTISINLDAVSAIEEQLKNQQSQITLSDILKLSTSMNQYNKIDELIEFVLNKISDILSLDRILFFQKQSSQKDMKLLKIINHSHINRHDFSQSLLKEIEESKQAVFIKKINETYIEHKKTIFEMGINSIIAIPLHIQNSIFGIIQLDYFQSSKQFSQSDFHIVCIITQLLSHHIQNLKTIDFIKEENQFFKNQMFNNFKIIGHDIQTLKMKQWIEKAAPTHSNVLITGESGTGKELVARSIHQNSPRKNKPFIVINCASIPDHLIESEFFGHKKGAFTGAQNDRKGKFEAANEGTVFLDEIGDMEYNLQAKLLRFLETGEIQSVGSNETLYLNVRILAATNKNLRDSIEKKEFRADLYYRLSVINIHCPPLRERKKDIIDLALHYLHVFSRSMGHKIDAISLDAKEILLNYSWPGNIRELKNTMERACVILEGTVLDQQSLPDHLFPKNHSNSSNQSSSSIQTLENIEKEHIMKTLQLNDFNKAKTSQVLGITRKTLYSKLKQYNLE